MVRQDIMAVGVYGRGCLPQADKKQRQKGAGANKTFKSMSSVIYFLQLGTTF
jgi:hypothetical protein